MKFIMIMGLLNIFVFGSCNEFLINADKAIKESENNVWINKKQEKSIRAIMYMMRYNICKEKKTKKEKHEL